MIRFLLVLLVIAFSFTVDDRFPHSSRTGRQIDDKRRAPQPMRRQSMRTTPRPNPTQPKPTKVKTISKAHWATTKSDGHAPTPKQDQAAAAPAKNDDQD